MTRSRTAVRKQEREKQQRRQQRITIAVLAVCVVALLAIFILLANQPAEAPIPEGAQARYEGLSQNFTNEGYPRLGSAAAPVQVAEYCTFDSVECAAYNDTLIDPILERVRAGSISFTFAPLYSSSAGNSQGAARAAVCAAQQDAFWPFHDALYAWQRAYGVVQAFTNNRIVSGIGNLGLNRAQYDSCMGSDRPGTVIDTAFNAARGITNFGTAPTITINNVVPEDENGAKIIDPQAIIEAIDRAIAVTGQTRRPEATSEATTEARMEATSEPAVSSQVEATTAPQPEATQAADATAEATAGL